MGHHSPDPTGERGRGCQCHVLFQHPELSCTHNHPKILCPQEGRAGLDAAGHPSGMKGWGGILGKIALDFKGRMGAPLQHTLTSLVHPVITPVPLHRPDSGLVSPPALPPARGEQWLQHWHRARWHQLPRWPGAWPPPASCCCSSSSAPSIGTFAWGGKKGEFGFLSVRHGYRGLQGNAVGWKGCHCLCQCGMRSGDLRAGGCSGCNQPARGQAERR